MASEPAVDGRDHDGLLDDHHSPLPPENYLRLRVEPSVRFYQDRLPSYYRTRYICETLLLAGTLSGTVMAFIKVDEWVAIVTAVTAMVTAWTAFSDTSRKLRRCVSYGFAQSCTTADLPQPRENA